MAGMLREARGRMRAAALAVLLVWGGGVQAQGPAVPAAPAQGAPAATLAQGVDSPPPADAGPPGEAPPLSPDLSRKIEELRNLLADPDIRAALAAAGPPEEGPPEMTEVEEDFDIWITQIRAHLWSVIKATRDLPEDLSQGAANAVRAIDRGGWLRFLLSVAAILGGAFAVEALCRRLLRRPAALPEGGSAPPPGAASVPPGSAPSMVMPASAPWPPTVDDPAEGEAGAAMAGTAVAGPAVPASAAGDAGAALSTTDAPGPMAPPAAAAEAVAAAGPVAVPPIPAPSIPGPPDPVAAEGGAPVRPAPTSASGEGLALFAFMMALAALHVVMHWPSPLGRLVQPWLLALIFVRVTRWLVRLSFRLPDASRLPGAERFWLSRLTGLATVLAAGWALSRSMAVVGAPVDHVILLRYATGLALIVFSAMTIWQQPATPAERAASRPRRLFLTVWLVLLAVLELMGTTLLFWIGVYVAGLPLLLRQVTRIVRGTGGARAADGAPPTGAAGPLRIVLLDRAVRAAVITLAMMWLGWIVRHHPASAVMQDETLAALSQGLLRGIVVLLLADLAWQAIRVWVDATLARPLDAGDAVARAREARLRTLLPLLRAALGVLILSISVMMVLAGLGVEIGPMIAGAGIFGVAIGFGSQALVKDVISGIFYMLDDAFRVGEYIQSGNYKGTVEGFSLRSVRLRHHRGSVYVVPFGALGAVQNMSRDWAKDKFLITVPFETDVEKVRKLVKKVGEALRADPEFGPLFIEPMKMKGVEQFGDYGITLAVSMILRPSSLTATIRRRAYMMIRQAFQDNGIEFASPKVQVEGGAADEGAAAAIALAQRRAAEAAAAASS